MEEKPNYYAVIPASVRYDERLTANEKLLYGEITALASKEGYCWASNTYFSELYNVSPVSVSRWINNLKKCDYIIVELVYKNNSREIEKRKIGINKNVNTYIQNCLGGINKIVNRGINKNVKENNTSINNININKRESKERKSTSPTLYDVEVYVKENNLKVNPKKFYDYFEAGDWKDAKGNKVLNWKQKLLTWNSFEKVSDEEKEIAEKEERWRRFMERHKEDE